MTKDALCLYLCVDQGSALAQGRVFAFPFAQAQLNMGNAIDGLLQSRSCCFRSMLQVVGLCQAIQISFEISKGTFADVQAEGLQSENLISGLDNFGCLVDCLQCSYIAGHLIRNSIFYQ